MTHYRYFAPTDVRGPFSHIMGVTRDVTTFMKQIRAFTRGDRGPVLDEQNRRFRFKNPLLRPYIVFRGVDAGLISEPHAFRFSRPEVSEQLSLFDP